MADGPRFLTPAEVGEVLNVSVRQIYTLMQSGELRAIQVGPRNIWRVEAAELEKYIERQYAARDQTRPRWHSPG